jgi:hypothetical protein
MTERKGAKLIALIEEIRRDDPRLANRVDVDVEADAMAKPVDPAAVVDAFKETHEELIAAAAEGSGAIGAP